MTGLDRIIDRILSDAKEEARLTLEAAQNDCKRMAEDYAAKAEDEAESIALRASEAAEELVENARLEIEQAREKMLSDTKKALVDEAFRLAKQELRKTEFGKYRELLTALLTSSLLDVTAKREEAIAKGEATGEIGEYRVVMNEADRAAWGESVVRAARCAAYRHMGAARVDRVHLADETADIDGGLHLYCDDVCLDLSLEALLQSLRTEIEPRVLAMLFPEA
ncbi:MAG: hypothetical protein E7650_00815 [Ruminococcaceae bacterium]|nr:hypothetical protein [Oscillospiraceae bacterium]